MNYNIGDFIITSKSSKPAIIIVKDIDHNKLYLISIYEFMGDYIWIDESDIIEKANLKTEDKLSIFVSFGSWYYDQHKLLYQELIIENITPTNI